MPISELTKLRDQEVLMDFTIKIGDAVFRVHKLILAAHSEYFKAMFTNEWSENVKNELVIDDINPDIFKLVLKYCYSWDIKLTRRVESEEVIENMTEDEGDAISEDPLAEDDIVDLLSISSRLQMQLLMELCAAFACENITISNCISLLYIADSNNLKELNECAVRFCCESFEDIVETEGFSSCGYNLLQKIIQDDRLQVSDERQVYEAIAKWVEIDPTYRESQLHHLLRYVRLVHSDPSYLIQLGEEEMIKKSKECSDLVENAKRYLLLIDNPVHLSQIRPQLSITTRVSTTKMYVFGGATAENTLIRSYETYNMESSRTICYVYPSVMAGRKDFGVASFGEFIYIIGGRKCGQICKTNLKFNRNTRVWSQDMPPSPVMKVGVQASTFDGRIYTYGGYDGVSKGIVHVIECYDPAQNCWSSIAAKVRCIEKCAMLATKGCIYEIGGYSDGAARDNVDCFNISTKEWVRLPKMNRKRMYCGACVCRGSIYVIGGNDGKDELNSAEVYDEEQKVWHLITPMNGRHKKIRAVVFENKIYAISDDPSDQNTVEVYDPSAEKWTKLPPLKTERHGFGIVIA